MLMGEQRDVNSVTSSVPQNVLVLISFSNGYYRAVTATLDQIAPEVLGHSFQRCPPDIPLHLPDALLREITNDPAVSVELLFPVVQQPVLYQWWDTPLLGPNSSVSSQQRIHHFVLSRQSKARSCCVNWSVMGPSPIKTQRSGIGQGIACEYFLFANPDLLERTPSLSGQGPSSLTMPP